MKHILFVCTGNTCRSPLAEYLLRQKAPAEIEVRSAGVSAMAGGQAAPHVQQLLAEKGIEMNHLSQPLSTELLEWADLVLTMTKAHQQMIISYFPGYAHKIFTLKEYIYPECEDKDISDPYGGSLAIYKQTEEEIEKLLDELLKNRI